MGQGESKEEPRQDKDSADRKAIEEGGGLQKFHEENQYEPLPAAKDINNVSQETFDQKNSRVRSLIAVCNKFPKTSEKSYLNPAIEDYIKDLRLHSREEIAERIKKLKEAQSSRESLNKAVEYFAMRLAVADVSDFITRHKNKVTENAEKLGYFLELGMSEDEAFTSAFSLSFYTGLDNVKKQAQAIESKLDSTSEEHYSVINHCLLQAINHLPFYWGTCIRTLQLSESDQEFYQKGSVVSWNILSSATKGNKPHKSFADRNTYFYIQSLTGREISQYSNFPQEDEILFPPYSTFLVVKKISSSMFNDKICIYLRQMELGLDNKPVLWVDDCLLQNRAENRKMRQSVSTRGLGQNAQLIPKISTESALSFLDSKFGQAWKELPELKIITDMARLEEVEGKYAGAIFLKKLRERGFKQKVLIYTMNRAVARAAVKIYCENNGGDFEICTEWGDSIKFIFS